MIFAEEQHKKPWKWQLFYLATKCVMPPAAPGPGRSEEEPHFWLVTLVTQETVPAAFNGHHPQLLTFHTKPMKRSQLKIIYGRIILFNCILWVLKAQLQ